MKGKITRTLINEFLSNDEEHCLHDTQLTGLHVRKREGRKGIYYLFYRNNAGIQRRPKVGPCAVLSSTSMLLGEPRGTGSVVSWATAMFSELSETVIAIDSDNIFDVAKTVGWAEGQQQWMICRTVLRQVFWLRLDGLPEL